MKPLKSFLIVTTGIWVAVASGCRSAPRRDADVDTLLRAVSYDTTFPPASPTTPPADATPASPVRPSIKVGEKASSLRQTVGDGLKATAGLLLLGAFKIVESALGGDDDSTVRGEADSNFNRWLDDRERWRRDAQ